MSRQTRSHADRDAWTLWILPMYRIVGDCFIESKIADTLSTIIASSQIVKFLLFWKAENTNER